MILLPARHRRWLALPLVLTAFTAILTSCRSGESLTFRSVHAGERHTCAIATDGSAWCWGANRFGQLGDGTNDGRTRPVQVLDGHTFTTMAIGFTHTCGIDDAGDVWCWGGNFVGNLGDGTTAPSARPVRVKGLPGNVDTVSATDGRSCAIAREALWCWGDNTQNVMGAGPREPLLVATRILPANVTGHAMGPGKACTLAEEVLCVGIDIDRTGSSEVFEASPIEGLPDRTVEPITEIEAAQFIFCGRTDSGRVFCWGSLSWFIEEDGKLQDGVWFKANELPTGAVSMLTTMEAAICALENATVMCRGKLPGQDWVSSGGVGAPTVDVRNLGDPWVIPFPGEVLDVSGGYAHICAVVEGGHVWCLGSNTDGQLGNGDRKDSLEPVRVAAR